jgi:acyl dehydratase
MIPATPGQQLPELVIPLTRSDVVRYAGAATDFNPIHWSDRAARAVGMPGVIVHGMWTMGAALRVVTDWCGDPGRVMSFSARFSRPVPVPDTPAGTTLRVQGEVTEVSDGIATVAIQATAPDEHGEMHSVLAAARARVRL